MRDAKKQRLWLDLPFVEWFLTKIGSHVGYWHCKTLAGNALRDIWLFNQIWIMMNKDTMKKFIWFLPVVTRNFELSTRTPKFLSIRLFWIVLVSAWRLWESNWDSYKCCFALERALFELSMIWASLERIGAKRGKTPISGNIVDVLQTELLKASVGIEPVSRTSFLHWQYAFTTTTRRQCAMLRNYVSCNPSQTRQTHWGI